jgi:predicted Zn-dependent peptidase
MRDPMHFDSATLPSGLRVFHQERDAPWLMANLVVTAGHLQDPIGKEGTAHVLEHYLHHGTFGYAYRGFEELKEWALDQRIRFRGASTDLVAMHFGAFSLIERSAAAFAFLNAFVFHPSLDGDLEHDKAIVRMERINRTSPRSMAISKAKSLAVYGDHRYATSTGLPDDDILEAISYRDVTEYHERHFHPKNAFLVSTGGLETVKAVELFSNAFTPIGRDWVEQKGLPAFEPRSPDPKRGYFAKESPGPVASKVVTCYWTYPFPETRAFVFVRQILGQILNRKIREEMHATYGVHVGTSLAHDHGGLSIRFEIEPQAVETVLSAVELILAHTGSACALLDSMKRTISMNLECTDDSAADTINSAVDDIGISGTPELIRDRLAALGRVTPDDITQFMRDWLTLNRAYVEIVEH